MAKKRTINKSKPADLNVESLECISSEEWHRVADECRRLAILDPDDVDPSEIANLEIIRYFAGRIQCGVPPREHVAKWLPEFERLAIRFDEMSSFYKELENRPQHKLTMREIHDYYLIQSRNQWFDVAVVRFLENSELPNAQAWRQIREPYASRPKLDLWRHLLKRLKKLAVHEGAFWGMSPVEVQEKLQECSRSHATSAEAIPNTVHSDDFRAVQWFGQKYAFTPKQAQCVQLLWKNWKAGTPDVAIERLLDACESNSESRRLDHVFRSKSGRHPAWGSMIQPGTSKGMYRLVDSQQDLKTHKKP